jgi:serine phosphatase RsbU (regulator of sigma subunit)
VADCTGHGIPGAFMSVLGISLMNQIVIEEQNTHPSLILQRLNHKIKKAFTYTDDHQSDPNSYDGMDISICSIHPDKQQVEFAGAFRPIYFYRDFELNEIRGSRYPIGGLHLEEIRDYKSCTFSYDKGNRLYLFSDGYSDQFGGPCNRKLMAKTLKNILHATSTSSMQVQQERLHQELISWQGEQEQTDDILLIGIELG